MVDFGSTYTKVTAVDLERELLVGRAQSPTTVEIDINIGLRLALQELYTQSGIRAEDIAGKYACSSAAGGLKMAAIGLVPDLTLKAAQMAALGAGAKVLCAYGYELDSDIALEIEKNQCDIVLLCGGTDGGNKQVILHNAEILANSKITCPILVCGNRSAAQKVTALLETGGKQVYTAANVLPTVNRVEVGAAQALIREIFISHIIQAKGLSQAEAFFERPIIPTPSASMEAAALLADGTRHEQGIGDLLVVEVGGATTNIHSVANNAPITSTTLVKGLPEPRLSRTVEGDMGIRYNARTIFDFVGGETLCEYALAIDHPLLPTLLDFDLYTLMLSKNVGYVPQSSAESAMDIALAGTSVGIAVERHAGYTQNEFTTSGHVTLQYGKNLLGVKNIIGTGGIFKYGNHLEAVLKSALFDAAKPWSLKPNQPCAYVDHEYILYAMGLLSQDYPDQALRIAKKYLRPVEL